MKIPGLLWGFCESEQEEFLFVLFGFIFIFLCPGTLRVGNHLLCVAKQGGGLCGVYPIDCCHFAPGWACEKSFPWRDQRVLLRVWATSGSHSQPYLRKIGRPSWLGLAYPGSLAGLCYGCLPAWEQVNGREEGLTASSYTYEHEEWGEAGHYTMCLWGRGGTTGREPRVEHATVVRLVAVLGKGPGAHNWHLGIKHRRSRAGRRWMECI